MATKEQIQSAVQKSKEDALIRQAEAASAAEMYQAHKLAQFELEAIRQKDNQDRVRKLLEGTWVEMKSSMTERFREFNQTALEGKGTVSPKNPLVLLLAINNLGVIAFYRDKNNNSLTNELNFHLGYALDTDSSLVPYVDGFIKDVKDGRMAEPIATSLARKLPEVYKKLKREKLLSKK